MAKGATTSKSNAAKPEVKKTQKSASSEKEKKGVRVSNEAAEKIKGESEKKKVESGKKETKKENKKEVKHSGDKDDAKEKDGLNNPTRLIGGSFNVNKASDQLKDLINKTLEFSELGCIQSHFAYSAIAELLALYIVRLSGKYNTKSAQNADLYEVSLDNLVRGIRESKDFGSDVKSWAELFNSFDMPYVSTFYDTEDVMVKFLEKKAFPNTSNVHISKDGLNFVCYMLSRILTNLTRIACLLSECGKKGKVQIRQFLYASRIAFTNNGELYKLIVQRLDEITDKVKSVPKKDGESEDGKENEEGGDSDSDEKKSSDSKGKKGKGKSANNANKKASNKKASNKKDAEPEESDGEKSDADESESDSE